MLANIPSIKINNNELAIHNRVITHGIRRAKFQRQFLLKKIHRYQFFNEEISFFFHVCYLHSNYPLIIFSSKSFGYNTYLSDYLERTHRVGSVFRNVEYQWQDPDGP